MSHNHNDNSHEMHKVTTLDLIKRYLNLKINKMTKGKVSVSDPNISLLDQMKNIEVNHIAIVIDGEVQDVMRAQNKMAAMLLSDPQFILFDPAKTKVGLNYGYRDGQFIEPKVEDEENN